jgi:hypothetical protein
MRVVAAVSAIPLSLTVAVSAQAQPIEATSDKSVAAQSANNNDASGPGYLWLHFGATNYEKVYYGYSSDGLSWKKLNDGDPIMSSSKGTKGIRDPHVLRLQTPDVAGNKYVMLGTDLHAEGSASGGSWDQKNASKDLVVSRSKDLVTWTTPELVPANFPDAGCVWAPEAIWDEETQDYLVYWSARDRNDIGKASWNLRVYKTHTKDFSSYSTPSVWLDESALGTDTAGNIIDTTVVKGDDGDFYRFSTSDWYTVIDTAPSLDGQWTRLVERDSAVTADGTSKIPEFANDHVMKTSESGLSTRLEGLTVFQDPAGKWVAMGDNGGYSAYSINSLSSLKDSSKTGKFSKESATFSARFRHGTVMRLTSAEQQSVLNAYSDTVPPVAPDKKGSDPIAAYDFEDDGRPNKDTTGNGNDLVFHNVTEYGKPGDWDSKVVQLRGGKGDKGQYLEFPQGLFDGRNEMTLEFSSKSRAASGSFFTFSLGKNDQKYFYFRLRGGEATASITKASWKNEVNATASIDTSVWHRYAVTVSPDAICVYVDGALAAKNTNVNVSVSDLGKNLTASFGKSFYAPDGYYDGGIDDVQVYNYAKSEIEMVGPAAAITVKDTDQVLSQNAVKDADGAAKKTIVLDYWKDAKTGSLSTKKDVSFDYSFLDGVTVTDEKGKSVSAADLSKISDYSKPVKLKVTYEGETIDYEIGVEVLVTPVRISGDEAASSGIGEKDPTGQEGWKFFADPQVVALNGKYYIFPTTDGYSGWSGHSIHAFESDDLVTWTDKGTVVDLSKDHDKMPDGRSDRAWAPAFAERNGKYYLYFSGGGMVNVAVSDPAKGGTATSGYEIQKVKVESSIDPAVFHDPQTDKWWLTWGQGPGKYAELADDMTSIKPGTTITTNATKNMREGSYITARQWNGKWTYYYSYSIDDTSSPNYRVGYATASSMEGDGSQWTYRGEILNKDDAKGILGTAHHSILQVPGTDDWYVVYHAFLTDEMRPRGHDATHNNAQLANGNKREIRISRMTFTEPTEAQTAAGEVPLINQVPVTYEGVLPETTPSVSVVAARSATRVGGHLTAVFNDGWKGVSWQWLRNGEPIDGATQATYTPVKTDAGQVLSVQAVAESTTGVLNNAGTSPTKTLPLMSQKVSVETTPAGNDGQEGNGSGGGKQENQGSQDSRDSDSTSSPTSSRPQAGAAVSLAKTGSSVVAVAVLLANLVLAGVVLAGVRARRSRVK